MGVSMAKCNDQFPPGWLAGEGQSLRGTCHTATTCEGLTVRTLINTLRALPRNLPVYVGTDDGLVPIAAVQVAADTKQTDPADANVGRLALVLALTKS